MNYAMALALGMVALLAALASPPARAEKPSRFRQGSEVRDVEQDGSTTIVHENGKTVLYKKRNTVDLDDKLLEGDVHSPSDFYFVHRPEEQFGSLVQRRKNFHKEMLRDTVMIR